MACAVHSRLRRRNDTSAPRVVAGAFAPAMPALWTAPAMPALWTAPAMPALWTAPTDPATAAEGTSVSARVQGSRGDAQRRHGLRGPQPPAAAERHLSPARGRWGVRAGMAGAMDRAGAGESRRRTAQAWPARSTAACGGGTTPRPRAWSLGRSRRPCRRQRARGCRGAAEIGPRRHGLRGPQPPAAAERHLGPERGRWVVHAPWPWPPLRPPAPAAHAPIASPAGAVHHPARTPNPRRSLG